MINLEFKLNLLSVTFLTLFFYTALYILLFILMPILLIKRSILRIGINQQG